MAISTMEFFFPTWNNETWHARYVEFCARILDFEVHECRS